MTISHNDDGSKTISCSAVLDFQSHTYSPGDFYPSGNLTLTTIPRYASINSFSVSNISGADGLTKVKYSWSTNATVDYAWYSINGGSTWASLPSTNIVSGLTPNTSYNFKLRVRRKDSQLTTDSSVVKKSTYDISRFVSIPNINIGNSQKIDWTNPSGAVTTLKLCKTDGTTVIDYGTVTGTSKTVTPTASTIYALTPNSNTITLRYIITTAGNYTAYKDCVFTVTNSNPTFNNFEYEDINTITTALTGNNQILVKGYSNVKGIISTSNKTTANNSATMKTYKMLIGNKNTSVNYSSDTEVSATLNSVDSGIIDMYATDSRGNSTKASKTATIKNYSNIKIISLSATRQNNVGQVVTLKFEAQFWNDSFGSVNNSITSCKYNYKLTSESSYTAGTTTLEYTVNENKVTGSISIQGDLGASGFNVSNSYNIELVIADKLSSATYTIILGSGEPAIAVYKNNVAIGQKYDTSTGEKLQVKGNAKVTGTINGYTLNTACGRGVKNATAVTNSGWGTNNNYVPDMSFIAYWNGAYSGTSSNLTYAHQGTIQCKPTTLYDNSSGTTGTVTLNQTAANFNYLEIFYARSSKYNSVKVFSPNGKVVQLTSAYAVGNGYTQFGCKVVTINGTSITSSTENFQNINSTIVANGTQSTLSILRVIGYK